MKNEVTRELIFARPENEDLSARNVVDYFKEWETEAIKAELSKNRADAVAICFNLSSDFNKGSVLRALNAHNLKELWLIGKTKWHRRGSVGTHHYSTMKHSEDWESVFAELRADGYTILAVDNTEGAESIYDQDFPAKTAFVFGEEMAGLSKEVIEACDALIYIEQYGSVRSMNISQAAAICFYEYRRGHRS
jgi:tRNA G18 (ribose-2'-O)-methylase SpoU